MSNQTLQHTQHWFASIITQPLIHNELLPSKAPSGALLKEEAEEYITPGPLLAPHERIQIYGQQYWWRLLKTLHTNFPLLTRLFGYLPFNQQIGVPYLQQFPPDTWSLSLLGEQLPAWIKTNYHLRDRKLVFQAAELDYAFLASFLTKSQAPPDLTILANQDETSLLKLVFYLQQHVFLFRWNSHLLNFRETLLEKEINYWTEHPFPPLPKLKTLSCLLYRDQQHLICWKEISQEEQTTLELFKQGRSLDQACKEIEKRGKHFQTYVSSHLQRWLIDWIRLGLLTLKA